ncbi:MAG: ATP-binding cassette domain-containing protein [Gammaproteobacteria bacterium]|jgi:ABC-type iron transport system FetAB ATPase subunit|nr:ATP-binding cassette domain-containing protein [Gammaproteobacteria bacterium]
MLELISLRTALVGPISLRVAAGECVAIHGPSGSGKTRLLRAIADLDPHEGEMRLDDTPAGRMTGPEWRRAVQLLPADPLWWEPTVSAHFTRFDAAAAVALGLPPESGAWPVDRLSSGERQRLALLRALDREPRVLLLDEPTANLDETSRHRVEALLARYRQDKGAAVIWVSHDAEQRARVATRKLRLRDRILVPEQEDT